MIYIYIYIYKSKAEREREREEAGQTGGESWSEPRQRRVGRPRGGSGSADTHMSGGGRVRLNTLQRKTHAVTTTALIHTFR